MLAKLKYGPVFVALIWLALPARSALAINAEVARKCETLAAKAYPLRVPGNPAAGRKNGTAIDVRNYFNKCVANGGNMNEQAPKEENAKKAPPAGTTGDKGDTPEQMK